MTQQLCACHAYLCIDIEKVSCRKENYNIKSTLFSMSGGNVVLPTTRIHNNIEAWRTIGSLVGSEFDRINYLWGLLN